MLEDSPVERQGGLDAQPRVETMEYLAMLRRMIRAGGRRVALADEPELERLIQVRAEVEEAIRVGIQGQRERGRSWAAIAEATGTTRQAAHERYSKR